MNQTIQYHPNIRHTILFSIFSCFILSTSSSHSMELSYSDFDGENRGEMRRDVYKDLQTLDLDIMRFFATVNLQQPNYMASALREADILIANYDNIHELARSTDGIKIKRHMNAPKFRHLPDTMRKCRRLRSFLEKFGTMLSTKDKPREWYITQCTELINNFKDIKDYREITDEAKAAIEAHLRAFYAGYTR